MSSLALGAKGPIIARDKIIQVVEVRGDNVPGQDVWFYMRKLEDSPIKYVLCNESMEAAPELSENQACCVGRLSNVLMNARMISAWIITKSSHVQGSTDTFWSL